MLAGCCMHFKDVSGYLLHLEMYVSFGSIYKSHIFFLFRLSGSVAMCLSLGVLLKEWCISVLSLKAVVLSFGWTLDSPGSFWKISFPACYPKPIYISISGARIQAPVFFLKLPRWFQCVTKVENHCLGIKLEMASPQI